MVGYFNKILQSILEILSYKSSFEYDVQIIDGKRLDGV